MSILLCDAELQALTGLPHTLVTLYVMAIRPRMDYVTGMVGVRPRISYQALREWAYVEPAPGRAAQSLSHDQLYRALRSLERAGLVVLASIKEAKQLVFKCPLALTFQHAQNKAATKPRQEAAPEFDNENNGLDEYPATDEIDEAATHRSIRDISISVESSSSSTAVVDRPPQGGAEGPRETAVPLDVRPAFALETQEKQSADRGGLIFHRDISDPDRASIAGKIEKLGNRRQTVLDELAGHMTRRKIESPVRYVDFIIQKAVQPVWVPEYAGSIAAARERVAAQAAQVAAARGVSAADSAPRRRDPERAAELAKIIQPRRKATA